MSSRRSPRISNSDKLRIPGDARAKSLWQPPPMVSQGVYGRAVHLRARGWPTGDLIFLQLREMSTESNDDRLYKALSPYRGFIFRWQRYRMLSADWDHDHCLGCWARFAEQPDQWRDEVHTEGWVTLWPVDETANPEPLSATETGYICIPSPKPGGFQLDWLCPRCFEACRERLGFTVDPDHPQWT